MIRDDTPHELNEPTSVTVRSTKAKPAPNLLIEIPFMQRPTCTIEEACRASGVGRTKFYELIKAGDLKMVSVGRRRLVQVPSLLKLLRMDSETC